MRARSSSARFSRTLSLSFSLALGGLLVGTALRSCVVWFYVSTQSAIASVCVGGAKPDPRTHYLTHSRLCAYTRTFTNAYSCARWGRVLSSCAPASCVGAARGEDGMMEGNGTEKGSEPRREIGPPLLPLPSSPPATRHSFIFYFQKS